MSLSNVSTLLSASVSDQVSETKYQANYQIMENQSHRNVNMEHELVVDGVNLRESKELIQVVDDESGQPKQILIHSRSIGDKKYVVKQVKKNELHTCDILKTILNSEQGV